jgi:hypothetical protein
MRRRNWFLSWIIPQTIAAQTLTSMVGLSRYRRDFNVVTPTDTFPTKGAARSAFIDVFRNGLLQRQGPDYTVSIVGGVNTVAFTGPLTPQDYVTLFYWS